MMGVQTLFGPEKLQQVTQLLDSLIKDWDQKQLTSAQQERILLQLRQHGTRVENAGPIYCKSGIEILEKYGTRGKTADVRRAALRCIANALLLEPSLRQVLVDTDCYQKLAERLKCDSSEDELVVGRLLFFSTYNTTVNFEQLISQNSLVDNIVYQIDRHTKQLPESGKRALAQADELAFIETVKVIHNVTHVYAHLAPLFSPCIGPLFEFINRVDIPPEPLEGVMGYLVNSLASLDLNGEKGKSFDKGHPFFPRADENCTVDKLIKILDRAISVYPPEELEVRVSSLLTTILVIYKMAPDGPRKHMEFLLLPEQNDRSEPIGKSDSLSSRLLRLYTGPHQTLKQLIRELMLSMSDNDAESLTKNIGFGFASGMLLPNHTETLKTAQKALSAIDDDQDRAVNPITGQRLDAEPVDAGPPMDRAEKEREAERLFVLFERAKARGLVAENPVRQFQQEGRLEELSDSDDSG